MAYGYGAPGYCSALQKRFSRPEQYGGELTLISPSSVGIKNTTRAPPFFPGGALSCEIERSIEGQAKQKTAVDLHELGDHHLVHLLRMMHQRMHDRSLASYPRRGP